MIRLRLWASSLLTKGAGLQYSTKSAGATHLVTGNLGTFLHISLVVVRAGGRKEVLSHFSRTTTRLAFGQCSSEDE